MPRKLILWDIDGTLLASGGVAAEAMRTAMEQIYGRAPEQERRSYAGKTDQQIILETFAHRTRDEVLGALDRFTAAYLAELYQRRDAFLTRGRVLDGVVPTLDRLLRENVVQSLLTGNVEAAAHFKLDLMGLAHYFDFASGAYGSDHDVRAALVPIAAARAAERYGRRFIGSDVVVIGDTPNDIACGRAAGARTVAVATGPFSTADLQAHRADAVLADLTDQEAVLRAIFG